MGIARIFLLGCLLGLATMLLGCGAENDAADSDGTDAPPARNVIFIVVDALRADHVGAYGHSRPTTPFLDRFAEQSVLFERAYSATSWTLPSLASYMSSVYPSVHGLRKRPDQEDHNRLPEEFVTLAESLSEHGLHTASITAQPWLSDQTGLTQGFDHVSTVGNATHVDEAHQVTRALTAWLRENHEQPFFLYAHYMGPHSPYEAPPRYKGRFTAELERTATVDRFEQLYEEQNQLLAYREIVTHARDEGLTAADIEYLSAQYDEKLAYADSQLGVLFDEVRQLGLLDDTLIVITADHGEAFFEHGTIFHGQHVHEELVRVPLIVRLPGARMADRRVVSVAETIDIYPTIHDVLELSVPEGIQGQSLVPLMHGEEGDGVAFSEGFGYRIATRDWSSLYDYSMTPERTDTIVPRAMYHLATDPLERVELDPVGGPAQSRHVRLANQVWQEINDVAEYWQAQPAAAEIDPETAARLRSLGYLQ